MIVLHLDDPAQSDVPITTMTFPDGQPHVSLDAAVLRDAARASGPVEVIARIADARRVVELALVLDATRSALDGEPSASTIGLTITYMLGARMDRRIAPGQPATLHVIAAMLAPSLVGLRAVRVLDPHSPMTLAALPGATALLPDAFVAEALADVATRTRALPVVVVPDQGAIARTTSLLARLGAANPVARCVKKRDSHTGALSGFALAEGDVRGRDCVIVDDICDGGGTFSGIAHVLARAGARSVSLVVTHGVLSRGPAVEGIETVYCTDSYGLPDARDLTVETDGAFVSYRRAADEAPLLRVRTCAARDALAPP